MSGVSVLTRPATASYSGTAAGSAAAAAGVFDTVEAVFWSLCRGPSPLALPGGLFTPGRRRPVRLPEARELLLWPGRMHPETRDVVWSLLVRRAQSGGPEWVVAAAGVLLPGLRRAADRLRAGYPGDSEDLQAEVLTGFLAALRAVDPDAGRLAARLYWAGYRAGAALRHRDATAAGHRGAGVEAAAPPRPWGHPDFVLAAAVAAGVLRAQEAELIGRTRLEGVGVQQAAAELGVSRNALLLRRSRAERRLVTALRQGQVSVWAAPDLPCGTGPTSPPAHPGRPSGGSSAAG